MIQSLDLLVWSLPQEPSPCTEFASFKRVIDCLRKVRIWKSLGAREVLMWIHSPSFLESFAYCLIICYEYSIKITLLEEKCLLDAAIFYFKFYGP